MEGVRAKLVAIVAAIISYFDEHPHLLELIQRAELLHPSGKEFPWQQARTNLLKLIDGLFKEADRCGEFTVSDSDLATLLLLGGVRSVIRLGEQPRPHDLPGCIVDTLLNGAMKEPPQGP